MPTTAERKKPGNKYLPFPRVHDRRALIEYYNFFEKTYLSSPVCYCIVFLNQAIANASKTRPELRTPPPLTPEGEVVQPVPERSFLQKYWMYLAAVLVALRMWHICSLRI